VGVFEQSRQGRGPIANRPSLLVDPPQCRRVDELGREVPLSGGHLSRQSPTAPGNYLALWPATARTFRAPERRTLPTPRRFSPAPTFGVTFGAVPLRDDRSPGGRAPDVAYVPGGRAGRCPEVLAVTFGVVNRELAAHADVHAMDSARGTRPAPRCPRPAARSGGISFALTPLGRAPVHDQLPNLVPAAVLMESTARLPPSDTETEPRTACVRCLLDTGGTPPPVRIGRGMMRTGGRPATACQSGPRRLRALARRGSSASSPRSRTQTTGRSGRWGLSRSAGHSAR
jgi:hypothetical protein